MSIFMWLVDVSSKLKINIICHHRDTKPQRLQAWNLPIIQCCIP